MNKARWYGGHTVGLFPSPQPREWPAPSRSGSGTPTG